MTELRKYRYRNPWKHGLIFLFILVLIGYYIIDSGLGGLLFHFDVNAPDLGGDGEAVRRSLIQGRLNIHSFMHSFFIMSSVGPVVLFAHGVFVFYERKGTLAYRYVRGGKRRRILGEMVLHNGLYTACSFFAVYMLYLCMGFLFLNIPPSQVPLNFFDGLFGENFEERHRFAYFTLLGVYKAFLFPLTYSILANCIALCCQQAYQVVLFASTYYYGLVALGSSSASDLVADFLPVSMLTMDGFVYDSPSPAQVLTPLLSMVPALVLSAILFLRTVKRRERFDP